MNDLGLHNRSCDMMLAGIRALPQVEYARDRVGINRQTIIITIITTTTTITDDNNNNLYLNYLYVAFFVRSMALYGYKLHSS